MAAEKSAELGHEMTLFEHLIELRKRLVRSMLAVAAGVVVTCNFYEELLMWLLKPLKDVLPPKSELIATHVTETFFIAMKTSIVAGIFLASPYIFYQVWQFVAPGLYREERRVLIPVAFFTALCFVSGGMFGYFVVFPFGFTFLSHFASDIVVLMPALSEYFSFAVGMLLAFGVIFELPVFIFFLARLGMVNSTLLRKQRRWAILGAFIAAAVLTPTPDAVNQILMAGPIIILYEISIWVSYLWGKERLDRKAAKLPVPAEGEAPAKSE